FTYCYIKKTAKPQRPKLQPLIQEDPNKDDRLIAAGLKQNPEEDVTRGPIIADDDGKGYDDFEERTKKFFANIVYPQGFLEFLKKYGKSRDMEGGGTDDDENFENKEPVLLTRYIERGGEYFVMDDVYPQDELIEINDYILTSAEYYSQFNNVLFFADDESGHCHFLLDYGKGGEPKVKYLDDETDVVRTLAENFAEFTDKLKECTYDEYCEKLEEYDKIN
ncbi:MAG: SMI1/KNR4 family protein, partial [Clostridia bacterium]|nr:SMI1/KNR4 family protein [Clostridia bacterium]